MSLKPPPVAKNLLDVSPIRNIMGVTPISNRIMNLNWIEKCIATVTLEQREKLRNIYETNL